VQEQPALGLKKRWLFCALAFLSVVVANMMMKGTETDER
jgi:hypothetical protein